ncbi:MAG TPA: SRPBCC domain-containing protein [Xanthobacteraceae bacterium]|nr:SRPBCC domain-containing protein [Xanthobacteraceae bacterium]
MNSPVLAPTERALVITRVFDAPRELVWTAWTDREHARHWWGPRHHPSTHVEIDARVGGKWRIRLTGVPDGRELWHGGVFREVVKPERLVFTFKWDEEGERGEENLVSITFAEEGGKDGKKTRMTFRQTPFVSVEERDGHTEGWTSSFDRLEEALAAMQGRA